MKVTLNHLTKRWSHEQRPIVDLLWFNAGCTGLQEFECFLTESTGLKELLVLYILQTVPSEILHKNIFPVSTWSHIAVLAELKIRLYGVALQMAALILFPNIGMVTRHYDDT